MLLSFEIELLADVRRYPGSKRYPHFNEAFLQEQLPLHDIEYIHYPDLGGRRTPKPDSANTAWRNTSFKGYADYMETAAFKEAIQNLKNSASLKRTAYMCSEAPWWRCHRALISDYLKAEGWTVHHIMQKVKSVEHPYTSAATVVDGQLLYHEERH